MKIIFKTVLEGFNARHHSRWKKSGTRTSICYKKRLISSSITIDYEIGFGFFSLSWNNYFMSGKRFNEHST